MNTSNIWSGFTGWLFGARDAISPRLRSVGARSLGVATFGATALFGVGAEAHAPVDCRAEIQSRLGGGNHATVWGTRINARDSAGFQSFIMNRGFEIERTPLHTAAVARQHYFIATASRDYSYIAGDFTEVFPARGNGDEDDWTFELNTRTGAIRLKSLTWSGPWQQLTEQQCFRGPTNQLVITGHGGASSGFGPDFWTFLLKKSDCSEILC